MSTRTSPNDCGLLVTVTTEDDARPPRPPARFSLPETHAALARWCEITGLDETSAEWGEVSQVLRDTGLLDADRCPPLFDEAVGTRALRMAVVGGALVSRAMPKLDLATATAVTAALLECRYADMAGWPEELALTRLEVETPQRVIQLADSPADALAVLLRPALEHPDAQMWALKHPSAPLTLHEAMADDRFALRVFDRLGRQHGIGLAALSYGGWLLYDCS